MNGRLRYCFVKGISGFLGRFANVNTDCLLSRLAWDSKDTTDDSVDYSGGIGSKNAVEVCVLKGHSTSIFYALMGCPNISGVVLNASHLDQSSCRQ